MLLASFTPMMWQTRKNCAPLSVPRSDSGNQRRPQSRRTLEATCYFSASSQRHWVLGRHTRSTRPGNSPAISTAALRCAVRVPVKPIYTSADWIPFATDGGGNSLAVDLAPEPGGSAGQVIVIGSDEDARRVIAPSVVALLRLCASRLWR